MKRTQKRIVGFLSLIAVIIITAVAIMMPAPTTQATSGMTDHLTVRVISSEPSTPSITMHSPTDGAEYVLPNQTINFDYTAVNHILVTIEYTDVDGVVHLYTLKDSDTSQTSGSDSIGLNLSGSGYGYGKYKVKVTGTGDGGDPSYGVLEFEYLPVITSTSTDEETGESTVYINYDPDSDDIDTIIINIYDENGNPVEGLSPITIKRPDTEFKFNVNDYGLDGKYLVETIAYNSNNEKLYKEYNIWTVYHAEETKVPNTGSFFVNTNISQTDYLITGLLVFGIVGVVGIGFAMRNNKKSYSGKSNRRR